MSAVLDPAPGSPQRGASRRSREELEKMAAEWVGGIEAPAASSPAAHPAAAPRVRVVVICAALALALGMVVWVSQREPEERLAAAIPSAPAPPAPADEAIPEPEANKITRQQQPGASDYLEKMAAADEVLLQDLRRNTRAFESRVEPVAVAQPPPTQPPPVQQAKPAVAEPAPAIPTRETAAPVAAPPPALPVSTATTPVARANCQLHVSELSSSGRLTYADIARVKGARKDPKTGHVFTPPVKLNDGRSTVFEVMPDGCARIVRSGRR